MVESTGLENRQACKRLVGSNPTPSATFLSVRPVIGGIPNPPLKVRIALAHCRWLEPHLSNTRPYICSAETWCGIDQPLRGHWLTGACSSNQVGLKLLRKW